MNESKGFTPLEMRISNGAKRKRFLTGFTLVELLVVIAIIALLMSILMPALHRVKKQAKLAACKMNLHQWAIIWAIYCEDNDGRFCHAGNKWRRGQWIVSLRPQYETKADMLRCPLATKRPPGTVGNWGGPFHTYLMGTTKGTTLQEECSYGANCWIYNSRPGEDDIQKRPSKWNWKMADVKGGNNIPVFGDSMWRGGGPFSGDPGAPRLPERGAPPEEDGQWSGANSEMKHFCINRHEGRIDMLFLDWSARSVDLKELWKLKWHREFNTNGNWTKPKVMPRDWPDWMLKFKDY